MIAQYRGALLGLAAGDALGTTVEFQPPGTFPPVAEIVGGGPFNLAPGQWTDDTSMALCLAESLIETAVFDPVDQLERYRRWFLYGHWSSTGRCFDIGVATRNALIRFEQTGAPYCGSTSPAIAGNGSLMRLAPVPLRYRANPQEALSMAADSSRTTHAAATTVDACRYFSGLLIAALNGVEKDEILSARYTPVAGEWQRTPLASEVDNVAAGSFKIKHPPQIRSTGYVVDTLEAALWAFQNSRSFEEGCCLAVNLGGDADTCGAVYGQLAGAFYGEEGILARWRQVIAFGPEIVKMADDILALSGRDHSPYPIG